MIWDYEDCPNGECDGELQQQDEYDVMCLGCEDIWTHYQTPSEHTLITAEGVTVARVEREASQ